MNADYSQYWVAAGPDLDEAGDSIPGLIASLGPQGVAVITGLQSGEVSVVAQVVAAQPATVEPGWEVVGETDLECTEGIIAVLDWGGPDHPELGELASEGPGRYRLRVHALRREPVSEGQSTEEHYLLLWPAADPAPPRLLTPMDEWGQIFAGKEPSAGSRGLDALDLAAAAGVKRLAEFTARPEPPELSGELVTVQAETIAPATPRRVWNQVSEPWNWIGMGDTPDPANFDISLLLQEPRLKAHGSFIDEEPPHHLAFTWSWTSPRYAAADVAAPRALSFDRATGQATPAPSDTNTLRLLRAAPTWTLPVRPTTVGIRLERQGRSETSVRLEHRDIPAELADPVQPFWDWALRHLHDLLNKVGYYEYPWSRT